MVVVVVVCHLFASSQYWLYNSSLKRVFGVQLASLKSTNHFIDEFIELGLVKHYVYCQHKFKFCLWVLGFYWSKLIGKVIKGNVGAWLVVDL